MVCFVGRLCHPYGSAVPIPSAWWDVLGSEFSGPLLGSSGFVRPSLENEEEENRVRSSQSLSVEGVTQLQRFNTQLPHFLWALNFLPFLPSQLWGLGSRVVCASVVITHPLKCLLVLPPHCQFRSVQQSLGNPVRNTHEGKEQGSLASVTIDTEEFSKQTP